VISFAKQVTEYIIIYLRFVLINCVHYQAAAAGQRQKADSSLLTPQHRGTTTYLYLNYGTGHQIIFLSLIIQAMITKHSIKIRAGCKCFLLSSYSIS